MRNGLGALLDKSGQTVARWEKGEVQIDGTAGRLLRLLYKNQAARKMLETLSLVGSNDGSKVQFVEDATGRWHGERVIA